MTNLTTIRVPDTWQPLGAVVARVLEGVLAAQEVRCGGQ
jgi:hypothetical protein